MRAALTAIGIAATMAFGSPARADIKVGIVVSATGPGSALGQPQMKAVAALPKEIGGERIVYIALDDEIRQREGIAERAPAGDPGRCRRHHRLVADAGHHADARRRARSRTPLLSLAASTAIVQPMDDKRKWAFKVVPNDDIMAAAMLKYIAKTGVKTLGFIGVSDGYGEGYYQEVTKLAPKLGITVTTHEVYARGDTSVTGQALKVIATNPDAVFIASAGTPAVLPQQALRERGYAGSIFQTHGVATQEFIKLGKENVEGAVFAGEAFSIADDLSAEDPFRRANDEFVSAYQAVNGDKPNIFAAHLWDTATLLKRAIPGALKVAKPGTAEFRAALRDALERGKDVYLNNGLSNMSPTDHNGYDERSAFLIKVEGGKFRLVK
ncbi:ABC transporter substrate-binding protein [Bradyrhizobium oligotrophicum S58]